jgi:hypothetical protein
LIKAASVARLTERAVSGSNGADQILVAVRALDGESPGLHARTARQALGGGQVRRLAAEALGEPRKACKHVHSHDLGELQTWSTLDRSGGCSGGL